MATHPPLLIDLTGVARLAGVQRPVASVWRRRFSTSADPFPLAVGERGGRVIFDADSVADWLMRNGRGKNPEAVADAAASASPVDFDISDPEHVSTLDALLTLRFVSGGAVGGLTVHELMDHATAVDPTDSCLVTEASRAQTSWATWADRLADAAYSPIEASRLLERRHMATRSSAGSAGQLMDSAEVLLIALVGALIGDDQGELILGVGIGPSLAAKLDSRAGDEVDLVVPAATWGRGIRRRRLCDGVGLPAVDSMSEAPRLFVERLPTDSARSTTEVLTALDNLVLGMRDHDRVAVLAPASALVGSVGPDDMLTRTDVLRTGRVRTIVKLPAGLLVAAPREALALWVLGRETVGVAIADRITAVADLTEVSLTETVTKDLASDVLAAMGSVHEARAHSFRFAQFVRTASLVAARGTLPIPARRRRASSASRESVPALLDLAFGRLGEDAPTWSTLAVEGSPVSSMTVDELLTAKNLRLLAGTRVAADEYYDSGFAVISSSDLDDPRQIGARHVDPIVFWARHPTARRTTPGDIVFRTSPTAKAWVDPDGEKVVLYPARILRIRRSDPGGLVPELVAADINHSRGGAGQWRRWRLRRVAPAASTSFRAALSDLADRREALARRIDALDSYVDLLSSGVVSGTVLLAEPAASEH